MSNSTVVGRTFHATYGGEDVSIDMATLSVLTGSFMEQGLRLLKEWANLHRNELQENWERARRGERLKRIKPLA